jgi:hypothetical protein
MDSEMIALSHSLVVELAGSIGFRNSRLVQNIMWPIFRPATNALARIGLTFDRNVSQSGFAKAMGIALKDFASSVTTRGAETIPPAGPLLVVSNHPGTYDSLVVASQLGRDDLNLISGDIPFLRSLPHANARFFCIDDNGGRLTATRKAIRHMQRGGAMLLYGFGHIDPDPAVYEDAPAHIERWSPSIDLFMKHVPDLKILVTTVSHVVSPKWRNSILYRLRKEPLDRRRLVEFGQVITQLVFPRKLLTAPFITFAPPVSAEILQRESGSDRVLPAVVVRGKALLADHIAWTRSLENARSSQHPTR